MLDLNLQNKTALVTGATSELGRVITRTLAQCGADLVIHYLQNETKALELQAEAVALGRKAMIVQADVGKEDSVLALKEKVLATFPAIDILVLNAVTPYKWTTILEQAPDDYLLEFNSCVMHAVHFTKAFVPGMMERKYGRVIGINTECAMQAFTTQSAYVAGKRGMDGILRVLAKEVGMHQITVNQVAPGWTISDRDRANKTEIHEGYAKNVPLKRRGTDQEIANAVAFLASDLASFISGVYLPVCGGNVMPAI